MSQHDLDILALSGEQRPCSGFGKLPSGHSIIFSGPESRKEHRVALMMTRKTNLSLLKLQPFLSRILTIRFASQHAKLSAVVCYAPTKAASDDVKEFYRTLQSVASDIPRHDIACFVGDFNAKIGGDRKYCPQSIGYHGLPRWHHQKPDRPLRSQSQTAH
ncbi:hypothetical protein QYM36_012379 [Artemia franciscana]|uniref:Uncharacterized protein n=1 Tax=Artemia franciscana TaxID=6661 RepID=A0AA88KZV9_ARTSF|nr:hypothetical protein QYM36_012379 [Artemia franciscana]